MLDMDYLNMLITEDQYACVICSLHCNRLRIFLKQQVTSTNSKDVQSV